MLASNEGPPSSLELPKPATMPLLFVNLELSDFANELMELIGVKGLDSSLQISFKATLKLSFKFDRFFCVRLTASSW